MGDQRLKRDDERNDPVGLARRRRRDLRLPQFDEYSDPVLRHAVHMRTAERGHALLGQQRARCSDNSVPGYYVTISASLTYTSVMPYSILTKSTTTSCGPTAQVCLSSQAVLRVQ